MPTPPSTEDYVRELRHTITLACLNHEVWWLYKGRDTRPQHIGVMNRYSIFFQTSIHAHFVALVVALYRLYETRTDTYNIPRFLNSLEGTGALEADVIAALNKKIAEVNPLWIKVNILRNKAFAHRALSHTVEETFAAAGMTPNELSAFLEVTKDLMNELTHHLKQGVHAFNLGAADDLHRMLTDLRV